MAKPAKAPVEEENVGRPFGPVSTATTGGWRSRPWPFTPRAELQPATKPAKALVEEEKGARPLGPVSIAAKEGWRTRPWSFTPRAEQAISFGGPVAEETFGMASDGESVKKALMASSSVAVTSEDSPSSNLATLMAPAESLPDEVREPLSGVASTPSGARALPETARPSPAPVPATARMGTAIRINRIHRPNVVARLPVIGELFVVVLFVVFLTLIDPLRIQPWSQDRRNQTKSNRELEISRESRQKRTDRKVASKGHRRDKIENTNKNTQTVETN